MFWLSWYSHISLMKFEKSLQIQPRKRCILLVGWLTSTCIPCMCFFLSCLCNFSESRPLFQRKTTHEPLPSSAVCRAVWGAHEGTGSLAVSGVLECPAPAPKSCFCTSLQFCIQFRHAGGLKAAAMRAHIQGNWHTLNEDQGLFILKPVVKDLPAFHWSESS